MLKQQTFVDYLNKLFPVAKCELNFSNTFELLVAVILSAQCTDKRVNLVTEKLFKTLKTPQDFVKINQEELEKQIYSCGFYRNKAKNIKACALSLVQNYNSLVPNTMEELLKLNGVGRKTANVVLSVAYKQNCVAVDTHVLRVSNRLGFTKSQNPNICERDLVKRFKVNLDQLHYKMVLFGRYYCKSQRPECKFCELKEQCIYFKQKQKIKKEN